MALNSSLAGAVSKKTETSIKLPLGFILFGLAAFPVSQFILFLYSSSLAAGAFRTPVILMAAHLLLLGWLLMTVMGAMYQLVPVAFLTKIWNEKIGFFQLFLTGSGIIVFSLLLGYNIRLAWIGAIPVVIGVLLFLYQMMKTLSAIENKTPMAWFVQSALVCLLLTIMAGLLLVWNLFSPLNIDYGFLFQSHLLLGITGWFSLLIFGFSYKMVPMFSLSHGFSSKWAKWVFISYTLGLVMLLLSFVTKGSGLETSGWILLWIGFTLFALDIKEIVDKRVKKRLDRPFLFSLTAIGNGWVVHSIAVFVSLFGIENSKLSSWLVFIYIFTWIIFSVLGYLYKIVPFLWWTHKYAGRVGKEKVPMLKDMVDNKLAPYLFIGFATAAIGLAAGSLMESPLLVKLFQGIMLAASIGYSISIARVLGK